MGYTQPQLRGVEPQGFIHLPKIGEVSHQAIMYFMSAGSSYSYVRFVHDPEPRLLTEGTAYFRKRLPDFVYRRNKRHGRLLINPEFVYSK
jgi:hypothetical protein